VKLPIKVIPASSQNKVMDFREGVLRVKVSAPPEKGKANKAVIRLLSEFFGVDPSKVIVSSGGANPRKIIEIVESDDEALQRRLGKLSL
jgi:uncharacterized protein (TIGR00251 family)